MTATDYQNKRYVDEWGRIWIRINEWKVWNDEAGYGGWFDGQGLEEIE